MSSFQTLISVPFITAVTQDVTVSICCEEEHFSAGQNDEAAGRKLQIRSLLNGSPDLKEQPPAAGFVYVAFMSNIKKSIMSNYKCRAKVMFNMQKFKLFGPTRLMASIRTQYHLEPYGGVWGAECKN